VRLAAACCCCLLLVAAIYRLDGEKWEVIEADASSGLVKYARMCDGDTEQEISLEELEEATLNEASALRACGLPRSAFEAHWPLLEARYLRYIRIASPDGLYPLTYTKADGESVSCVRMRQCY
jgi:hypothetical protein